jgi:2-hydroxychromene-2-carboxylate isomerase
MAEVEFFFDVGSPYSYLAYLELPKIAARRAARIIWRPILLGGVFKATGNASPAEVPAKRAYMAADLQRWAQHYQVPFKANPYFPINTLGLMRGAAGMLMRGEPELKLYLDAIFTAMFEQPRNLNDPDEVAKILGGAGIDAQWFLTMIADPAVKEKLRQDTEAAISRGVFGAPAFVVGDSFYWGQDRLSFVDKALAG